MPAESDWFFTQETDEGKGVNFWLTDSLVWQQDTLQVELSYPKSDSLNILRPPNGYASVCDASPSGKEEKEER